MTHQNRRTDWHSYLRPVSVAEAWRLWEDALGRAGWRAPLPDAEVVSVAEACGRVSAEPVYARLSSPHYAGAAMDGIAVRAADTFGASETTPVILEPSRYGLINTGNPLPPEYDAVVKIEDVDIQPDGRVVLHQAVAPWQDVRSVGEDIAATELLLPENRLIRPVDVGALLAGGITCVAVRRRPRVAVIPTGRELVDPFDAVEPGAVPASASVSQTHGPAPGQIIEFNSYMLSALVAEWGAQPIRAPGGKAVPDDEDALRRVVEEAVTQADLVLVNAGSSAGSRDLTAGVLASLGKVVVHGVNTRPGKPVILAEVKGKPVVGIPGFPVSAVLAAELFARPLIAKMLGVEVPARSRLRAASGRRLASAEGVDEFIRVQLGRVGGRFVAVPLSRGAGVITSLVRADGILRLPPESRGVEAGEEVDVELLVDPGRIDNTVVLSGSNDPALDLLSVFLERRFPGTRLSVAAVGSLGGLMAVRRGEAHLAGSHLLDEATGEYNFPYIRRYLGDVDCAVVNFVHRLQGFIVRPGNPLKVTDFADLVRSDIRFVNRQRGAGTRVLLDIELAKRGIAPSEINGYEREEYTHLAVAAAVATGTADVGLGLYSAARAFGLDFVPVAEERYDFVVPESYLADPLVQRVLSVLGDLEFREEVAKLGGYRVDRMGERLGWQEAQGGET